MENDFLEGEKPEYVVQVETKDNNVFRYRALILILVLMVPLLIAAFTLISSQMDANVAHVVQPHLPQFDMVITF